MPLADDIAAEAAARGWTAPLEVHEALASTQDRVKALAAEGAVDGTAVLAREQSAGRGRLGRRWAARRDEAVLLSVLRRVDLPAGRAALLSLAAGVGVREAAGPAGLVLKWPNDLLLEDGRKVAGLLLEADVARGRVTRVVVGVGLNVTDAPALEDRAAGCLADRGPVPERAGLVVDLVQAIVRWTGRVAFDPAGVVAAWRAGAPWLGRTVTVSGRTGVAEDVADDGALWLREADGTRRRVVAGDVALVGPWRTPPP